MHQTEHQTQVYEHHVVTYSLLEDIIEATRLKPEDEAYELTLTGLKALINEIALTDEASERVNRIQIDHMIAETDHLISLQLDEILHHHDFQAVESTWRSLKFLVDRTDFRENNKIEIMNVAKEELIEDFEDAPEVTKSTLYKIVYTREYGQFGGEPYGTIIGNFFFDHSHKDVQLLRHISKVAAMAHAPFISAAAPSMFGVNSWEELGALKDLKSIFEGPQYAKWRSLRETEDARYLGLTIPRFLLRLPYGHGGDSLKTINYTEKASSATGHYLWGNVAFALAANISDSFSKYRWCTNIIGPQGGGAVEDLPVHTFEEMGALQNKISTEVLISERKEFELAEEGFIGLTMRKGSDNAAFFSANSIQSQLFFDNTPEGREAESSHRLGAQFPYMFIINRLAHYLKVIQRENIGVWKERVDLQRELNKWIGQYVVDMENPLPMIRSRKPLKKAAVTVDEIHGEPGWYKIGLKVRPHFKYSGASFTLSLVSKLEKT